MIEDKLDHDERLRLECVAQAVASTAMSRPSAETIVETAKRFETYIREGKT